MGHAQAKLMEKKIGKMQLSVVVIQKLIMTISDRDEKYIPFKRWPLILALKIK